MGILGKVWNIAKYAIPHGQAIDSIGKALYHSVKSDPIGILGKIGGNIARAVVPDHIRNGAATIADTAISMMPEGKVKNTLSKINNSVQDKSTEYKKASISINPGTDTYGSFTKRKAEPKQISKAIEYSPPSYGRTRIRR
jgi:hypothetical protein